MIQQHSGQSLVSTIVKLFTSIFARRLTKHFFENTSTEMILDERQGRVRKGIQGTKDCLLTTKATTLAKKTRIEAFSDFTKAFDNVSHTWILILFLEAKFSQQMRETLEFMKEWTITLQSSEMK